MSKFKKNTKILYVDDEVSLLSSFNSLMRKENLEIYTLDDPGKIDKILLEQGPFAVVLSDQRMPFSSGTEILEKVAKIHPLTNRVLVTGFSDHTETVEAINRGEIIRYINKPWKDEELKNLLHDLVDKYNLSTENKFLLNELKTKNAQLSQLLDGTIVETIHLLTDLLSYINPHAFQQVQRIKSFGSLILNSFRNISYEEKWDIARAFELFNLGLAVMPPWVQVSLNKEGLSAVRRFSVCRNHHIIAANYLEKIPGFEGVANIIRFMEKEYNGKGEPEDSLINEEEIPLGSRLLKILLDMDKYGTPNFYGVDLLKSMMRQPKKYDVELLQKIIDEASAYKEAKTQISKLFVRELRAGMLVLENIKTKSGMKLLESNSFITETTLMALRAWKGYDEIIEPITVKVKFS